MKLKHIMRHLGDMTYYRPPFHIWGTCPPCPPRDLPSFTSMTVTTLNTRIVQTTEALMADIIGFHCAQR